MSLSIHFHGADDGDDGPFSLASANGWALVSEWVGWLPRNEYLALWVLATNGEVHGTDRLSRELTDALEMHPPDNPNVADTLSQLLTRLGVGDPQETATVTSD